MSLGDEDGYFADIKHVIPGEKRGPAEPCSLQTIGFGEM
jgi:hypothetical protein